MLRSLITRLFVRTSEVATRTPHLWRNDFARRFKTMLRDGEFARAEELCRERLGRDPNDSGAWYFLGRVQARMSNYSAARDSLERAINHGIATADMLCDLANVIRMQGDVAASLGIYRRALDMDPAHELSLHNLGLELFRLGQMTEALPLLNRLLAQNPNAHGISRVIASIYLTNGPMDKALHFLERARDEDTEDANIHAVLGATYVAMGMLDRGVASYVRSLELEPSDASVNNNLGYLYLQLGRIDQAIEHLEMAVVNNEEFPDALNNLAIAQHHRREFDKAEQSLRRALDLRPNFSDAHANLGKLLLEQGAQSEAEVQFRHAVRCDPASSKVHSNLLLCLNYGDSANREKVYRAHTDWASKHERPVPKRVLAEMTFDPSRRLRVGYVSPDFVTHSVSFFFEPILREHDPDKFEIYLYSNRPVADATTERLKRLSGHWREIHGLDDAAAASLIRQDRIDILVDLAGHTAGNRLGLMAKRASPLQVTYLGYPNTTGLQSIDYRLTDELADSKSAQEFHTERLVRLTRCFLCYQPPEDSPTVGRERTGDVATFNFAAFNNLAKLTDSVLIVWSKVLGSIPGSMLYLPGSSEDRSSARLKLMERFKRCGIDVTRIVWVERAKSVAEHLRRYNSVDIALDTYPYNGATTTMDALWMGVPVVTMYGEAHASRVGYSILSRIGLERLATRSPDEYVERVCELAASGVGSDQQREELRNRVSHSELTDAKAMARAIEEFYGRIWRQECESHR